MKPKLLIVDDEPDMLDFLERVFRAEYDITRASGGDEALAALEREPYDVLVTDQKMPRMSGLELLERIRDAHPDLVKVLITGFSDVVETKRAIERLDLHAYVLKPVDSEQLREAVAEARRR